MYTYLLCIQWEEFCVGGILCGRNSVWEESHGGEIPWEESRVGEIPWEESCVGGILVGGIPCGRNPGGRNSTWEESRWNLLVRIVIESF